MPQDNQTNPELDLISLIAAQIDDDERIIEGLGAGTLSLEDVERWRQTRWQAERSFLHETAQLIAQMRGQSFGQMMRSSDATRDDRRARAARDAHQPRARRRARLHAAPKVPAPNGQPHFTLELSDLGLPCSLRVSGGYDDVLDAGVWHCRRTHRLRGSEDSIKEAVKSAMVEEQTTRLAPEERARSRSEDYVSDESANMTRGSGFASA